MRTTNHCEIMEQKFILLNGGRDCEVEPFASTNTCLARLLGSEPAKRAVFYLRSMQDEQGRQRIAVFVGSQHVGYLPQETDEMVLTTIRACEIHGAVARARGSLTASWQQPGRVLVKVDLAEPEYLLSNSAQSAAAQVVTTGEPMDKPEEPEDSQDVYLPAVAEQAGENTADAILSSSLEDAAALMDLPEGVQASPARKMASSDLESSSSDGLSAGWTEDYPEWPPPKPKPTVTAQPPTPDQPTIAPQPAAPPPSTADTEQEPGSPTTT